jgi:molecular chaperone GrpE
MVNDQDRNTNEEDLEITNEEADTTEITDSEIVDIEERLEDKLKKLRAQLIEAQEAKHQALEDLQRERADLLNTKRRLTEQANIDRERATVRHIEELLPLCDSFDMAMNDPAWQTADPVWRKGVEGIYGQLQSLLVSHGVETLLPLGKPFNPHEQEAIIDNGGDHIVSAVVQKGYKRGGYIIRPARVVVGKKE